MSRIDEALRKARESAALGESGAGTAEAGPLAGAGSAGSAIPSADVFTAPWKFTQADSDQTSAPASPPIAAAHRFTDHGPGPALPEPRGASIAVLPTPSEPIVQASGPGPMAVFKEFNRRVVEKLVISPEARSSFVEQFRKLAGTLHHAQLERNIHVVMISSALAGEGKTLTSTNLALTLSESYRRRVLLIDADLRRPTLHEIFQVPNLSGLGDGLRADADTKLPIIQVTTLLSLLTAGRPDPDPMAGLSSKRMRRIIEEAAASFDWVIVDTPPVGLLTDAHLLAAMVDTTLLVIEAGDTPYDLVQRSIETIGRDRILGIVLNRADESPRFGRYGKYYAYYKRSDDQRRRGD